MAAACDRFRTGVLEGDLSRDGSPVLAAHVGHCLAKATPYGVTISKDSSDSPRKIDAAVAAVIAYERGEVERDERGRGLGGVGMIALTSCACCQTRRNPEVGTGRAFLAHLSQMTRITMQVSAYFCDTSRPIRDSNPCRRRERAVS